MVRFLKTYHLHKTISILILIFSFQNILFAQESQQKLICKVVDNTSKKPVIYATVMLKSINRGTHADVNGNFEIPIKYRKKGIIRISSIGYQTKEVKLATLKTKETNIIYLNTSYNKLNEIVVKTSKRKSKRKKRILAKTVVRKAIENILENYPTIPHSYIGYYRDYQQPVGNSYQKLMKSKEKIEYVNEAIIESFDSGFNTDKLRNKNNQALLYEYISNINFIRDSTLTVPYDNRSKKYSESVYITPLGGNELNLLDLTNAIRNHDKMSFSFANVFNRNFLKNHNFKIKNIVYTDDIAIYKISFTSLKNRTSYEYAAFGEIYISKNDFAIHKLNYNLYYRKKKNPQYAVTIAYHPKKDKMYLDYISFNNFFKANHGNYFKIDETIFNVNSSVFKIVFNRPIYPISLNPFKKKFKIYYKGKKLNVKQINLYNTRTVLVHIDKESKEEINFYKEKQDPNYATHFKFDITNIKDINGFKINERLSIKMNQYREFFVQEIFENKRLPIQKDFIDKSKPLSRSIILPLKLENNYWLNTPLKSSK